MRVLRHLFVFAALGLAACAGPQPVAVVSSSGVVLQEALPRPSSGDAQQATRQSYIGSFTELTVDVYGVPDLRREVVTDGEGKFSFPFAGTIDGAGKSTMQLATEIENRLRGR